MPTHPSSKTNPVISFASCLLVAMAASTARAQESAAPTAVVGPSTSQVAAPATNAAPPNLTQVTQPAPPAARGTVVLTGVVPPGPRIITDYETGDPVPPGYRVVNRKRRGAIIGGAVTFGVVYLLNVLVAAANDDVARKANEDSETDALYIPAFGPFIQMTKSNSSAANVFLALDGVAQTGGLALLIVGLTVPKTVLMRETASMSLQLAPLFSASTRGLSVAGRF